MTFLRKPVTLLVLVACLLLPAASSLGGGADRTLFTSGLHLEMDGIIRNLYIRGPAIVAPPGLDAATVIVTFDTDIPLRVGSRELPRGSHRFKLDMDPSRAWQLGPDAGAHAAKGRTTLTMTEGAPFERELSMRFIRTGRMGVLSLVTAWGSRRGAVSVIVDPGTGPAPEVTGTIDAASILAERGRLLMAMGDVAGTERGRGRWVDLLVALRAATTIDDGKQAVRLSKMICKLTDASLHLDIEGRTSNADYESIGAFRERLQKGAFGTLFKRINIVGQGAVPGSDGKTEAFRFSLQADAPPARWQSRRADIVLGDATGGSSTEPAKEAAYMDRRLVRVAGPKDLSGRGVSNMRDRMGDLRDLRRDSDVNLSQVDPSPVKTRSGEVLARYVVKMEARGTYDGLLTFISGVHEWDTPVWVTVESVEEANAGVLAKLSFEFLSYKPIESRNPGMWRVIDVNHSDSAFLEQTSAFLKRLPPSEAFKPYKSGKPIPDPFTGRETEPEPER